VLARACLALERVGVRLALGGRMPAHCSHLPRAWNKDHHDRVRIDALAIPDENGILWGYAMAEEADGSVLLQEMETFNP
jgi:hypothetical protein